MFERFTERARRVVVLAQEEARMLNLNYIGTEHLLLGLIHEGDGVAAKALESLNISLGAVRDQVQEIIGKGQQVPSRHIPFTPRAKKVLELSLREALQLGHNYIGTEHILLGLIREGEGVAAQVLVKLGADLGRVRQLVIQLLSESPDLEATTSEGHQNGVPAGSAVLDQFGGRNLTAAAREGKLDPVIGREHEMERVMQVLSRRTKNNPVLIGELGVGKTAIAEGLAQVILIDNVPEILINKIIYSINLRSILATQNSEHEKVFSEDQLENFLNEIARRKDILLIVDELHHLFATDLIRSNNWFVNSLKRILFSGELQFISTSTVDEFRDYVDMDTELNKIFQPVEVEEPSVELTTQILRGLRDRYEAHHRVTMTDSALKAAAQLTQQYDIERYQPGKSIDLLDEAGARLNIQRAARPPVLKEVDEEIATVRLEKEAAIDAQDFAGAASLRDKESKLIEARNEKEKAWRNGDLDEISEVTEDLIAAVLSERLGIKITQVPSNQSGLIPFRRTRSEKSISPRNYKLLSDRPAEEEHEDLLEIGSTAQVIASVLKDSQSSSPFVMAIDGGWGSGKSTLLNHIYNCLPKNEDTKIIRYNAWTSQGEQALEGLIKSVLIELDHRTIRRLARKMMSKRKTIIFIRIVARMVMGFLGAGKILDELWDRAKLDARSRNELRTTIIDTITEWTKKGPDGLGGRSVIILVDDLDRCSESVIIKVCEAVKLYLDAPGMIFVLACDMHVLTKHVASLPYVNEAAIYLEKIVQVVHRISSPTESQLRNLVAGYAKQAGISDLVDESVCEILLSRSDRNPRRIKRILNSFILASRLDHSWDSETLGNEQLVRVIVLQHLYPTFYEVLISEQGSFDPIGEFLDYVSVRERASNPPGRNHAWWATVTRFLRMHKIPPPSRYENDLIGDRLLVLLKKAEERLPREYPELAKNTLFVNFLRKFGDSNSRIAVRMHLQNNPVPQVLKDESAGSPE
ncbi:P-loop NTPase fold protein [Glutamicibacter soli]|nr:P-loop NTPase fold protein [Glutamicibacter soli]